MEEEDKKAFRSDKFTVSWRVWRAAFGKECTQGNGIKEREKKMLGGGGMTQIEVTKKMQEEKEEDPP